MMSMEAPVVHGAEGRGDVSHSKLFLLFLRVGAMTFGGGDPTLAALQSEMVVRRRWLPPGKYAIAYTLARITPGTNLLAFCAGTGWELLGWPGALAAVLAMTLPAALIVLAVTEAYDLLRSNPIATAALAGVIAAAVGMMATAAWQLAQPYFTRKRWLFAAVLIVSAIVLSLEFSLSPIKVLALAAVTGFFWREPQDASPERPGGKRDHRSGVRRIR